MSSLRAKSPDHIIGLVVRILDSQVVPAVTDREARASLLLMLGMLDNVGPRVQERRDLASLDAQVLDRMLASLPDEVATALSGTAGECGTARSLRAVLRRLRDRPEALETDAMRAWISSCLKELGKRSEVEIAMMRPTRYFASQR